jgi:thiamine biosynthesis lipoprotein ApbE
MPCAAVTIIASNATRTDDGLSKTVFILGPEKGLAFINRFPARR